MTENFETSVTPIGDDPRFIKASDHAGGADAIFDPYAGSEYTRFLVFRLTADFDVAQGWTSQAIFQRHIGDVNGDGLNDVVGVGASGVLVGYGRLGAVFSFDTADLVSTAFRARDGYATVLADIDGDGRADLIGFGGAGVRVIHGQTDGTFSTSADVLADFGPDQGWTSQDRTLRLAGDFNGDGKADLIGFGYAGALVALSQGGGSFANPVLGIADFGIDQGWTSDKIYHRAVADVNGDGFDDIVGFGIDGVLVALSHGDGTFAPIQLALENFNPANGWTNDDVTPRLVEDVNGDGRADIVGFGASSIFIAYGQADGTFSPAHQDAGQFTAAQGWGDNNLYPHMLGQAFSVSRAGFPDLITFGPDGIYVLAHNNPNIGIA